VWSVPHRLPSSPKWPIIIIIIMKSYTGYIKTIQKLKSLKKFKKANVLTPIIAHTANNFINVWGSKVTIRYKQNMTFQHVEWDVKLYSLTHPRAVGNGDIHSLGKRLVCPAASASCHLRSCGWQETIAVTPVIRQLRRWQDGGTADYWCWCLCC